jgi:hypothetical protein
MAVEWIGETNLAPSHLGPTPEFGPSGESPPLRTEPVVVSWALVASGPPLAEQKLTEQKILEGLRPPTALTAAESVWLDVRAPSFSDYHGIKRIVYRQHWQRDDPVIQLAPGETQTYSVQLNCGLTDQVLREFSSSLGLGGKVSAVELSAQLSGRLSRTVTISTELQTTTTKQLTNTRNKYMRRVAVWHVVHSVSLYGINMAGAAYPFMPLSQEYSARWVWQELQHIEFADIAAPQSTSFDVPAHRPV